MDIHLIDEFRRRTNASYDEARYYLERCNGDLLEAIVAFEKERTYGPRQESARPKSGCCSNGFIKVIQTLFDIQLVITDKNTRNFNIPMIVLLLLFPVWHIAVIMAIAMLFMGFKFNFIREQNPSVNVESVVNNIKDKFNDSSRNGQ